MRYQSVVLGGTFDRFHSGHEAILEKAFAEGQNVTIGLTTDRYVKKFKTQNPKPKTKSSKIKTGLKQKVKKISISSYQKRIVRLEDWLRQKNFLHRATIVPLDDSYGPTVDLKKGMQFKAIIVSAETRSVAEAINFLRAKQKMPCLSVIEIPMVPSVDAVPVSSTRIRNNEIDRKGNLVMPINLRKFLGEPIGEVFHGKDISRVFQNDSGNILVAVGDLTAKRMLYAHIMPSLAIIDNRIERKPFQWDKKHWSMLTRKRNVTHAKSGPGYISRRASEIISEWGIAAGRGTVKKTLFIIDGEEDLLTLPCICVAPLGAVIYYGQPGKGIVRVVVTQKKKEQVRLLLSKFT